MVPASGPRLPIGRGQQRVDFRSGQEPDLGTRETLAGNREHPLNLLRMGRRLESGIAEERANRGEA